MAGVGDSVLDFKVRMVLLAWHPVVLRSGDLYKRTQDVWIGQWYKEVCCFYIIGPPVFSDFVTVKALITFDSPSVCLIAPLHSPLCLTRFAYLLFARLSDLLLFPS